MAVAAVHSTRAEHASYHNKLDWIGWKAARLLQSASFSHQDEKKVRLSLAILALLDRGIAVYTS